MLLLLVLVVQPSIISADDNTESSPSSSSLRHLSTNLTSIFFIGDLHGDVGCAREWVKQTKLIDFDSADSESKMSWVGSPTDAIVFAGDYVDKGSTSSSVLSFVRDLQTSFPDNVVSILGNHDFFQILDAALDYDGDHIDDDHGHDGDNGNDNVPHPLRHPQHDYAYSFIHPEEYVESGYSPKRDDDGEIMKAIHDALQYVYDRGMEGKVRVCTSNACVRDNSDNNIFTSVPPFINDETLASRARERLLTWRKEYAQGLYDGGLLHWMVEQPLIALVGDALLVHGGLAPNVLNYVQSVAEKRGESVEDTLYDLINRPFTSFFKENLNENGTTEVSNGENANSDNSGGRANSIKGRLNEGYAFEIILNIIQHRGYFDPNKGCDEVESVLERLNLSEKENINRICVGHTPRDYAEEFCGGKLLASDSALSRSFRAYGNHYCPLNDLYKNDNMVKSQSRSCSRPQYEEKCDGSVSLLRRESAEHEWPTNVKHLMMDDLKDLDSVINNVSDSGGEL